jgi:hypothetical protein
MFQVPTNWTDEDGVYHTCVIGVQDMMFKGEDGEYLTTGSMQCNGTSLLDYMVRNGIRIGAPKEDIGFSPLNAVSGDMNFKPLSVMEALILYSQMCQDCTNLLSNLAEQDKVWYWHWSEAYEHFSEVCGYKPSHTSCIFCEGIEKEEREYPVPRGLMGELMERADREGVPRSQVLDEMQRSSGESSPCQDDDCLTCCGACGHYNDCIDHNDTGEFCATKIIPKENSTMCMDCPYPKYCDLGCPGDGCCREVGMPLQR